jgi:hypothetical protein
MAKKRSQIVIKIETDFKSRTEDGDDITAYLDGIFHDAVHKNVEEFFSSHEFESEIISEMVNNYKSLPKDIQAFSNLGGILISISPSDVKEVTKQMMIDDEQIGN